MSIEWVVIFLLLGSVVGFIAGLLGVGGGGILVPTLASLLVHLDIPQQHIVHVSLGTSMACIIVTSLSSALAHHKHQAVNWSIVYLMGAGGVIGTFAATFVAARTNAAYLALFFAAFMLYTAYKIVIKANQPQLAPKPSQASMSGWSIGIGAVCALVSIGGGSLLVPYLNRRGISMSQAVGTSAAIGLPIAVAGSVGYLLNGIGQTTGIANTIGYVYLPAVALISIASMTSAPLGAKVSHRLPVKRLKKLFALLLVVLGVKMLWASL